MIVTIPFLVSLCQWFSVNCSKQYGQACNRSLPDIIVCLRIKIDNIIIYSSIAELMQMLKYKLIFPYLENKM